MNTYIPFTLTRKAQIAHMKAFLKDPANRPFKDEQYGTKYARLFLKDYAFYAVMRGADYRKTSHMPDGANAKAELKIITQRLDYFLSKPEALDAARKNKESFISRYFPASQSDQTTLESIAEVNELIKSALMS